MTLAKLEIATSTEITVDKDIPMPGGLAGRKDTYPWQTMDVGDSFAIPPRVQRHFSGPMSAAGRKHNRKFSQRKMPDGTYRCWRIA